jgi:ATP-dependent Lhr-like helicase
MLLAIELERKLDEYSKKLGFNEPTPIQQKAWPVILRKRNCLISAPTGSGKTEAVILPVLVMLSKEVDQERGVKAIYITPLRSLNRNLLDRIKNYAASLNLEVEVRHGDTSNYIRRKTLLKPPTLLITTPETLGILLTSKLFKQNLKSVQYVIVDELHELMSNKRGSQLLLHLIRLEAIAGRQIIRIGISATLGNYSLASRFMTNGRQCAVIVDKSIRSYKVDVVLVDGDAEEVVKYLEKNIKERELKHVLIFCNTRDSAEMIGALLKERTNFRVGVHHGSLSRESREEVEGELRNGKLDAVVCTSSLELGIDVGNVDHVYQIDSPRQVTKLVQRVGRSSHSFGAIASGTVICKSPDDYVEALALVSLLKEGKMESTIQPFAPFDVLAVQIVSLAIERNGIDRSDIMQILRATWLFNQVTESEVDECIQLLVKSGLLFDDGKRIKPKRNSYDFLYSNISTIPEVEKYEVKELVSRKKLGQLDEKFVAENLEDGQSIILRGDAWRIISIDDTSSSIFVEKSSSSLGATPVWTGEMIPVESIVSKRVGEIRNKLAILDKRVSEYMLDSKQSLGYLPDSNRLIIEIGTAGIVLHTCFGSRINNAMQLLITGIYRAKTGASPRIIVDPYRIFILDVNRVDFFSTIRDLPIEDLNRIILSELLTVRVFHYAIWHSAKRYGLISPEAKYDRRIAEFLTQRYRDNILVKGVIQEMFYKKYDVDGLIERIRQIKTGAIKVKLLSVEKYSRLANMLSYDRVILSLGNHESGVKALQESLLHRKTKLVCLTCGNWSKVLDVFEAPDQIRCSLCNSRIVGVCSPFDEEIEKIAKKHAQHKQLDKLEESKYNKAWKSASLYMSFGKRAIMALSSYGIGEETAARVLRRSLTDEDLFRELYLAQRNFILYRKYWDD